MAFEVFFSNKAERFLKSLQQETAKHLKEEILKLEELQNPKKSVKKVEGTDKKHPLYSYRVGEYRAILTFLKDRYVIVVIEIDIRRTAYRKYQG